MSMSRKTITLLDHRRRSIVQERKERRSQLINHPPNHQRGIDHTYNTVQWLRESSPSFNQFDPTSREGIVNLAFEATSYDDVYAGQPDGARPRQSRVTFT